MKKKASAKKKKKAPAKKAKAKPAKKKKAIAKAKPAKKAAKPAPKKKIGGKDNEHWGDSYDEENTKAVAMEDEDTGDTESDIIPEEDLKLEDFNAENDDDDDDGGEYYDDRF